MKRKIESEDEDVPLLTRKKSKKTALKTKKKKRKYADDDDSDAEEMQVISFSNIIFSLGRRMLCFILRSCRNQRRRIRWKRKATVRGRRRSKKRTSKRFGNGMYRSFLGTCERLLSQFLIYEFALYSTYSSNGWIWFKEKKNSSSKVPRIRILLDIGTLDRADYEPSLRVDSSGTCIRCPIEAFIS